MKSRLYIGSVNHTRCGPKVHRFEYPYYTYALDLAELPALQKNLKFFGYNRRALVSLRDEDYLPHQTGSIEQKVRMLLAEKGLEPLVQRIELITSLRYFNYAFNPVNFYRCFGADEKLVMAIAEVNNTFGETHLYVLDDSCADGENSFTQYSTGKEFHVSPFYDRKGLYRFYFLRREDELDIRINMLKEGKIVFTSQLCGRGVPLNTANLVRTLLQYPLTALLTMPRITAQAARLYFQKKLPVYTKPIATSPMTVRRVGPTLFQKSCVALGKRFLSDMKRGCLTLAFPDGTQFVYGDTNSDLRATLMVKNYDFFWRSIIFGDIGFGESYVDGQWESDNLTNLLSIFLENADVVDDRTLITSYLGRFINRARHLLRDNSITGSLKNISAHYDLSNELFQSFLDESMTYSCGLYHDPAESLEQAQQNKINALIRKAVLKESDHVLEIGCGWGSFAITAARTIGCRVTGLTLSKEQQKLATERAEAAGVGHLVDIRLQDYRTLNGKFDKIVSVEMLEAVGHKYLGNFFKVCDSVLNPDGVVALQVITFPDFRYDLYRSGCDWIQKYIFPGGLCPSLSALSEAVSSNSRLVVDDIENIGVHYAKTLSDWRERFLGNHRHIMSLGFDDRFSRIWQYYLAYCEAGFATRTLGTLQMVLARPTNKVLSQVPQYKVL